MPFLNQFAEDLLQHYFENVAHGDVGDAAGLPVSVGAGSIYVSLHTAWPGRAAASQAVSESAYGSYARQAVARSAAGWTATGTQVTNDGAITFPEATSGTETLYFFGLGFAVSGATTAYGFDHLGSALGPCTFNDTADDVQIMNHGLIADDRVVFYDTPGGTLPAGVTEGTVYYVIATGLGTDTFRVSTSSGGAALNFTADGSGRAGKVTPISVTTGVQPKFNAGDLDLNLV